jgi:hypothetical protein
MAPSQSPNYSVYGEDPFLNQINGSPVRTARLIKLAEEIDDPGEREAYVALFNDFHPSDSSNIRAR